MHQIRQNARPTSVRRAALVDQRARSSDDRAARRSTSALVGRTRSSLVDRSDERARLSSIDERARQTIAPLVDRRETSALVHRAARPRGAIVRFTSIHFPEVNWSENEGRNGFPWSKGKFVVNRKSFSGKIMFSVTAKRMHFPENHFRNHFEVDSNTALVWERVETRKWCDCYSICLYRGSSLLFFSQTSVQDLFRFVI